MGSYWSDTARQKQRVNKKGFLCLVLGVHNQQGGTSEALFGLLQSQTAWHACQCEQVDPFRIVTTAMILLHSDFLALPAPPNQLHCNWE